MTNLSVYISMSSIYVLVRFELYIYIYMCVCVFWLILNCKFKFFLAKKYTVGAVGTIAAPTNRFVGAAGTVAVPIN